MSKQSDRPNPQAQDSPAATFGRYGLYRTLMGSQTPKLRVDAPVSSLALRGGFGTFRKSGK